LQLIERAETLRLLDADVSRTCREAVLAWHDASRDLVADNPRFDRLARFARHVSDRLQAKFFGRRIYRWRE
jgi:hypothetical protein